MHKCTNDCQRIIREQYDGGQRVFWNHLSFIEQREWLRENHNPSVVAVVEDIRHSTGVFQRTLNWFRKHWWWPGKPNAKQVRKWIPKLSKDVCSQCGQVRD